VWDEWRAQSARKEYGLTIEAAGKAWIKKDENYVQKYGMAATAQPLPQKGLGGIAAQIADLRVAGALGADRSLPRKSGVEPPQNLAEHLSPQRTLAARCRKPNVPPYVACDCGGRGTEGFRREAERDPRDAGAAQENQRKYLDFSAVRAKKGVFRTISHP
jgi:hypothetical protein